VCLNRFLCWWLYAQIKCSLTKSLAQLFHLFPCGPLFTYRKDKIFTQKYYAEKCPEKGQNENNQISPRITIFRILPTLFPFPMWYWTSIHLSWRNQSLINNRKWMSTPWNCKLIICKHINKLIRHILHKIF
jgi:hypothetical protein